MELTKVSITYGKANQQGSKGNYPPKVSITYGKANLSAAIVKACKALMFQLPTVKRTRGISICRWNSNRVSITYGKANKVCQMANRIVDRFQLPTVKRTWTPSYRELFPHYFVSITYGKANAKKIVVILDEDRVFQLPTVKRTRNTQTGVGVKTLWKFQLPTVKRTLCHCWLWW